GPPSGGRRRAWRAGRDREGRSRTPRQSSGKSARLDRDGAYGITMRYAFLRRPRGLCGAVTFVAVSDARRGWAMWAPPALLFLIAFFHRSAPGIIAKDLMHDFNTTAAIVGLLSAIYFYAYAGLMIPARLGMGAFASTAPLALLVAVAGWRGALGIVGLVTLTVSALCFAVVRDQPAARATERAPAARAVAVGMVRVLRNPHTWPPFLAFFCLYSAFGNLSLWVVPYLRDVYG